MPPNTPPKVPDYSLFSDQSLKILMSRLQECNAEEVLDVIVKTGEEWFVEIVFKNNKSLYVGSQIPNHFDIKELDQSILEHLPNKFKIFWSIFDAQ